MHGFDTEAAVENKSTTGVESVGRVTMPRKFDKILYHGTNKENIPSILKEGLRPTYLGNCIICMSPNSEIAGNFGNTVLEVDVTGYKISCFEDCEGWERFVWCDKPIPPERIKVV